MGYQNVSVVYHDIKNMGVFKERAREMRNRGNVREQRVEEIRAEERWRQRVKKRVNTFEKKQCPHQ